MKSDPWIYLYIICTFKRTLAHTAHTKIKCGKMKTQFVKSKCSLFTFWFNVQNLILLYSVNIHFVRFHNHTSIARSITNTILLFIFFQRKRIEPKAFVNLILYFHQNSPHSNGWTFWFWRWICWFSSNLWNFSIFPIYRIPYSWAKLRNYYSSWNFYKIPKQ